jgi:hypothetical protein
MLDGIDTMVDRPPGHRRALLHLHDDDGVRDGGGGEAEHPRVVLDRVNPINGYQIEGPTLEKGDVDVRRLLRRRCRRGTA